MRFQFQNTLPYVEFEIVSFITVRELVLRIMFSIQRTLFDIRYIAVYVYRYYDLYARYFRQQKVWENRMFNV